MLMFAYWRTLTGRIVKIVHLTFILAQFLSPLTVLCFPDEHGQLTACQYIDYFVHLLQISKQG